MSASGLKAKLQKAWKRFSSSGALRNFLLFIPFLAAAAVFWLIVVLDDDLQHEYSVRVEFVNMPDSVTFITDPPASLSVSVRDRGTRLVQHIFSGQPVLKIDFRNYASNGRLRIGAGTLQSYLRSVFGSSSQILSSYPDSISVDYTTAAAKMVPVVVVADIVPEIGKILGGRVKSTPAVAKVYSQSSVTDTLTCVYTYPIVRRNLSAPENIKVSIKSIAGCRIEPSEVTVSVPVEPLENRSVIVPVMPVNVPVTESLMVYPRTVRVEYLVPMSAADIHDTGFRVVVDYNDVGRYSGGNIPLRLHTLPPQAVSATLALDSVEYTVIHR